jgi:hypothetical protein
MKNDSMQSDLADGKVARESTDDANLTHRGTLLFDTSSSTLYTQSTSSLLIHL